MEITCRYTLTYQEALKGNRAFKWLWRRVFMGLGLLLIAAGTLIAVFAPWSAAAHWVIMGEGVFLLLLPEVFQRLAIYKQRHLLGQAVDLTFSEAGVHFCSPLGESKLAWPVFKKAFLRDGFWVLRISPYQAFYFPVKALAEADSEPFRALLRAQSLLLEG